MKKSVQVSGHVIFLASYLTPISNSPPSKLFFLHRRHMVTYRPFTSLKSHLEENEWVLHSKPSTLNFDLSPL